VAKQKSYVVWIGRNPGIYNCWADCHLQVHKYSGAKYKSYKSRHEAEQAFHQRWEIHWGKEQASKIHIVPPSNVSVKNQRERRSS
jgi:ribonuclease HI